MYRKVVNILLVGETGVGKSTFINAFVNYLKFNSLDEAMLSPEITCLIPTQFTTSDENYVERTVRLGNNDDNNEDTVVGASCTQSARSYKFSIDNLNVRLIDTPGIGDTRGTGNDEENFEKLLDVFGELEDVHAFCVLLKPNNARLTVMFQYCVKQLLSRLDKSASQNIVFIFTNSRSTFYKPGDTPLREILNDISESPPYVKIPFGKDNVFCVDSEAFRFLVASREGIAFGDDERKAFSTSWTKSKYISLRLLHYVANLKPHKIKDTICINNARRLILNLSEALVLIAKTIDDNVKSIQKKKNELKDENRSIENLQKNLYFDTTRLRVSETSLPRLTCTHEDCITVYVIDGRKCIDYRQVCQVYQLEYYLKAIPQKVIGSPEVKECAVMDGNAENPSCTLCGHSYLLHMCTYVMTQPYISREINKNIDSTIRKKEAVIRHIEKAIAKMETFQTKLENEREIIQDSVAKFAHFLSNNAITPYNDKYREYVEHLLDIEKNNGKYKNEELIRTYEKAIQISP